MVKGHYFVNQTVIISLDKYKCELCGSKEEVEIHHIRGLKDLKRKGQAPRPQWVEVMAARQRKTLVVCRKCHNEIHHGHK